MDKGFNLTLSNHISGIFALNKRIVENTAKFLFTYTKISDTL